MKTVLIIAYFFPPVGGGAVMRTAKFVKYLPSFGWRPIVISANQEISTQDPSLLSDIPREAIVIRTPMGWFGRARSRLVQFVFHKQKTPTIPDAPTLSTQENQKGSRLTKLLSFFEVLVSRYVLIPDQQVFWKRTAIKAAESVLREHHVDAIMTSCPPHSTHGVGMYLQNRYHIPWVTDFRDVWTEANNRRGFFSKFVARKMERRVVRNADAVLATTEPSSSYLFERNERRDPQKFRVLTNGFDPEDFPPTVSQPNPGTLSLGFFGAIARPHVEAIGILAEVIHDYETSHPELQGRIRLHMFSGVSPTTFLKQGERNVIVYGGYLPHAKLPEAYASMDVLLLVLDDMYADNSYPGKMFEYMATMKPILALVNPGIVQRFIADYTLGWSAARCNREEMEKALDSIVSCWKTKTLSRTSLDPSLKAFSRIELTKRLAQILDLTVNKRQQSSMNATRPRILFLHSQFRTYRLQLFQRLAKRFSLTFLITSAPLRHYPKEKDWKVVEFASKRFLGYGSDASFRIVLYILHHIRDYDLILCSDPASFGAHIGFIIARLFGKRYALFTETWQWPDTFWARLAAPFVRILYRNAHAVIASGSRARDFAQAWGAQKRKIFLAPNSCEDLAALPFDAERYQSIQKSFQIQGGSFILLFFSRLIAVKDPFTLLKAYERFQRQIPATKLLIVGDGPLKHALQSYAKEHSLHTVMFHPAVAEAERHYYFTLADAVVLTGQSMPASTVSVESWGMILNEAISLSKPVIASSTVGASADLIRDGVNGFIVPPENPEALASAFLHAYQKRSAGLMQSASRKMYEAHSPAKQAEGFTQAILEAVRETNTIR